MTKSVRTIADRRIADDVAFAVLAAGSAMRFGGGKLDAPLRGRPLGRWATDAVEAAGAVARLLVVGLRPPAFAARLEEWTVVGNPDAARGIGTSIAAAVAAAAGRARLVIALADMPFVTADHLGRLARGEGMVFTRQADGRPGVPAAFPASVFRHLLDLPPDRGAAHLARTVPAAMIDPPNAAIRIDIDTQADMARWQDGGSVRA